MPKPSRLFISLKRFIIFRNLLLQHLGDSCDLLHDGRVIVHANEFSPARTYRSVQDASDHYQHAFGRG